MILPKGGKAAIGELKTMLLSHLLIRNGTKVFISNKLFNLIFTPKQVIFLAIKKMMMESHIIPTPIEEEEKNEF